MAKIKSRIFPAVVLLVAIIVLGGCTTQKKPLPSTPKSTAETKDLAADINKIAMSVQGVEKSYSVVVGNVALIGIDIDKDQQEPGISNIKNRVAEKAEADARIVRAYVSSDPDTTARIKELADNVRKGRPVTEDLDEIGEIIQRLTPQTD
ncbi:YhcN/YlaJ family sporulation lipoprotein [Phosphitispora sp. TUW77]|uniref:YhcN/YlaJ family sporulation lipoprotein n=1 Tax=Phosphitispora sp. TUW77 TaxID=3152361 RepID=UPI003AB10D32